MTIKELINKLVISDYTQNLMIRGLVRMLPANVLAKQVHFRVYEEKRVLQAYVGGDLVLESTFDEVNSFGDKD